MLHCISKGERLHLEEAIWTTTSGFDTFCQKHWFLASCSVQTTISFCIFNVKLGDEESVGIICGEIKYTFHALMNEKQHLPLVFIVRMNDKQLTRSLLPVRHSNQLQVHSACKTTRFFVSYWIVGAKLNNKQSVWC